MKRLKRCVVCGFHVDKMDKSFGVDYTGLDDIGVCPTCRKHAEIGKRVEGMEERQVTPTSFCNMGWNDCLREAKGEKP